MKIKYLVFVLTVGLFAACSDDDDAFTDEVINQYLDIPDTKFETKLISLGIDSDNQINQKILRSDAEKVRSLNLASQNIYDEIKDLTGIEGFVNLKRLYASGNDLTYVDLSSNNLLDSLNLVGNKIASIDVSNNTKLIWMDLKVNEITSITGLSEATNLKWLSLSFNSLEEFTSDNRFLENLYISDNLLTSFDVSGAINLKSLLIRTNLLPTIDLRANTQLVSLVLSNNKVQTINLTSNINLKYLYSSSNLLENLDVTNLQQLMDLRVDRNPNLHCIKIGSNQVIPIVSIDANQRLSNLCN